ncbi:hypothetical protein DIURU_000271 [Diutina rugosa]|uniref:EngB-type G domain-containing protein n=1 Tax=Diutina rugosa TaxID=5481 RepID=A0A642UYH2_DIURU|nr:uncharacterized protein DIURU_000271 [Diutina rugosa]KAA8908174.1 hypothetical protein DIURU_000271 [Diutina rugosa]
MRASLRCWNYRRFIQGPKRPRPTGVAFDASAVATSPVITADRLTEHFAKDEFTIPSDKLVTKSQTWWKRAAQEIEWTLADYDEIPDVKVARLEQERESRLKQWQPGDPPVRQKRSTYGHSPKWLKPLPEVVMLGHTNAGKSSILNALLPSKPLARVAKRPGYTKTVNCYNIGNQLRVLDSPGYGEYGEEKQGQMVLEYLERRQQCRKAYVLIDAKEGVLELDYDILDHVAGLGVSVDVVFTKVDEVIYRHYWRQAKAMKGRHFLKRDLHQMVKDINIQIIAHFQRLLTEGGIGDTNYPVNLIFTNSQTNSYVRREGGIAALRADIFRACGLDTR